jgi:cell division septation protein DedD
VKWIALLLLLANVALGGYIYLQRTRPDPDANLVNLQMNAEQIRVLPPRKRTPPPAAAACLEWRSFDASELARAIAALEPLALGERLSAREVSVAVRWWVYMPPQSSRAGMEKKADELRELGISEYFPITDAGKWRYAISLGIFRSEAGANAFLEQLRNRGVRSAVVGEREQRATHTVLTIREPGPEEAAKLAELSAGFPGTELKAVDCPL